MAEEKEKTFIHAFQQWTLHWACISSGAFDSIYSTYSHSTWEGAWEKLKAARHTHHPDILGMAALANITHSWWAHTKQKGTVRFVQATSRTGARRYEASLTALPGSSRLWLQENCIFQTIESTQKCTWYLWSAHCNTSLQIFTTIAQICIKRSKDQ